MRADRCPRCDEDEGVLVSDDVPGDFGIYVCRDCLIFYSAAVPTPPAGPRVDGWATDFAGTQLTWASTSGLRTSAHSRPV